MTNPKLSPNVLTRRKPDSSLRLTSVLMLIPHQLQSDRIPNLSSLKTTCGSQIEKYTRCVDSASRTGLSDKEMEENCRDNMKELWKCCESVLGSAVQQK